MKLIYLFFGLLAVNLHVAAQTKYFTKSGKVSFYSKAPLAAIEAHNSQAVSVFDAKTGQIECSVQLKGFEFEKARMQEDFNENFVESNKYPKAVYAGTIKNPADLVLTKDGEYKVSITGSLTLHGITKPENAEAVFSVKNGVISAVSEFSILLADYNVKIPPVVGDKIGKTVKIITNVSSYQPLPSKS